MTRILVGALDLLPGRGGVAHVARLSTRALAQRYDVLARACVDDRECRIAGIHTKVAHGSRIRHVLGVAKDLLSCTHAFYDFAGTGRGHPPFPRRPYAVWAHGYEVWSGNGAWPEPRADYQRVFRDADLILVNSEYTRQRAGRFLPSDDRVVVCPLATWTDDVPVQTTSKGPPTVLLLGRVDELFAKGHDLLIKVWPRILEAVPDARLIFVGGGKNLPQLKALAADSPAHASIEVAGFVPDESLERYWQAATVFAMPGFGEGFGLVYIDAMQRGIPVVASTDDAGGEVNVDGFTGFNVSRADLDQLSDRLERLLGDSALARSMGAAGRARWEQHYSARGFNERFHFATQRFLSP